NGEQISKRPEAGKWDAEDEDAYYRFSERQMLEIYNLGVLVTSVSSGQYGVGGVVVSKQRLDVNFARNDVQSSCPVFSRIEKTLRSRSKNTAKKKARLTDGERESL